MHPEISALLVHLHPGTPGDSEDLTRLEAVAGFALPLEYREFLAETNGGEGTVGEAYVQFWSVAQILELNPAYAVEEFAPGVVLIGSDGGDTAYGLIHETDKWNFVDVPFIGMSLSELTPHGESFAGFLRWLTG